MNSSIIIKDGNCLELKTADNQNGIKVKNNNGILEALVNDSAISLIKTLKSIGFDYFYKDLNTDIQINKTNQSDQGTTTNIIKEIETNYPQKSIFSNLPQTINNYFNQLTGADLGSFQYTGSPIHGNIIARICLASKNNTSLYSIHILKNGNNIVNNAISYQKIEDDFYSSGALYLSINTELTNNDKLEIRVSHVVSNNNTNGTTNTQIIALQFSFLGHLME